MLAVGQEPDLLLFSSFRAARNSDVIAGPRKKNRRAGAGYSSTTRHGAIHVSLHHVYANCFEDSDSLEHMSGHQTLFYHSLTTSTPISRSPTVGLQQHYCTRVCESLEASAWARGRSRGVFTPSRQRRGGSFGVRRHLHGILNIAMLRGEFDVVVHAVYPALHTRH
jgi:hypothetical protein